MKGIHPSEFDEELLSTELAKEGHVLKKVTNMKSKRTGNALPMYFVNLKLKENNKDVHSMRYLQNIRISIEPVKSLQKEEKIVQCHRCQKFGHTKNYCYHPPRCVKCGEGHLTANCKKEKDTPGTCALCLQNHPANYKGCQVRKEILQRRVRKTPPTREQREQYEVNEEEFPQIKLDNVRENDKSRPSFAQNSSQLSCENQQYYH